MELITVTQHYKFINIICKTRFGNIYSAFSLKDGQYLSVLKTPKSIKNDKDLFKCFQDERDLISEISHPSVSVFIENFEDEENFYTITDSFDGISLQSEISCRGSMTEDRARRIGKQIIDGLVYLHANNIAHCGISPDSILIKTFNGKEFVRLDNLNNIMRNGRTEAIKGILCPKSWAPPEAIKGDVCYGVQLDDWAAGLAIYFMLNGEIPWSKVSDSALYKVITTGTLQKPERMTTTSFSLVEKMLNPNPVRRFSSMQAQPHFWFVQNDREMPKMSHTFFASSPVIKTQKSCSSIDLLNPPSSPKPTLTPSGIVPPIFFE